jgi:hypothetical protein
MRGKADVLQAVLPQAAKEFALADELTEFASAPDAVAACSTFVSVLAPGGSYTHWKAPPSHGAHPERTWPHYKQNAASLPEKAGGNF